MHADYVLVIIRMPYIALDRRKQTNNNLSCSNDINNIYAYIYIIYISVDRVKENRQKNYKKFITSLEPPYLFREVCASALLFSRRLKMPRKQTHFENKINKLNIYNIIYTKYIFIFIHTI